MEGWRVGAGGGGGGRGMDWWQVGTGGVCGGSEGGRGGGGVDSPSSGLTGRFPPLCISAVLATSLGTSENFSSTPMGTKAAMAPAFCTGVDST